MNDQRTQAVAESGTALTPESTAKPTLHTGLVLRRLAILVLMILLVVPALWSAITGQRALLVDGLSHANVAVAVIGPSTGMPKVGDTVAIPASTATSVIIGFVDEVGNGTMALRDAVRSHTWTASADEVRGTVLAIFDGPAVRLLAGLHPLMTSTAIVLLIMVLVAIPLRRNDADDVAVGPPSGRHLKEFSDLRRG